jgi:hypothetical protein
MPTTTTLAPAAVFPIMPDGREPQRISRAFLTDVIATESGIECRVALRAVPVRTFEMTPKFGSAAAAMRFRARWLETAEPGAQPLRFIVPLWPRQSEVTAFPDAETITCDTRDRGFAAGVPVLITESDTSYELVDVLSLDDDALTLDPDGDFGAREGEYLVGPTRVIPTMRAWLVPPTVDQRGHIAAQVPLVFREELPGISGADPRVGLAILPEIANVRLRTVAAGSPWAGRKFTTMEAVATDAAGVVVEGLAVEWSVTDPVAASNVRVTTPYDGRLLHVAYDGGTGSSFTVVATVGGVASS